ncbi:MAG TPA: glycosyltransferase family 2 protein [Gemmatimonadaceae bacterium]|nr:glycosyltransferase family 2 protein [Gemmatimonadaceae bacterium]
MKLTATPTWILACAPWVLGPILLLWRGRASPWLSHEQSDVPVDAPLVSVIVPARNEAHNIARCVRSILGTRWPNLEVIVVDDRSDDGTGAIMRAIAAEDARLHVIGGVPVPEGWFGKQWACAQGAAAARGSTLIFTDADTVHGPALIPRTMHAMTARALDFFTVAGFQELGSFWERVVMPQVFYMIATRYGGAGEVNRATRARDKIANGQYLCFPRASYDALGGHEAVRGKAAEDLALAQLVCEKGMRGEIAIGPDDLSTRMYTSLAEVVNGWTKNMVTAGADSLPPGVLPRLLLPVLLLVSPLMQLAPVLTLLAAAFVPMTAGAVMWAEVCTALLALWWGFIYVRAFKLSPLYALTVPLGASVVLVIIARATVRGRGVEWKGRRYQAG